MIKGDAGCHRGDTTCLLLANDSGAFRDYARRKNTLVHGQYAKVGRGYLVQGQGDEDLPKLYSVVREEPGILDMEGRGNEELNEQRFLRPSEPILE